MIAAHRPVQRPPDARLLAVDAHGRITHAPRSRFVDFLKPGDLVVANDAATLPASLHGVHLRSGADVEVRLAGWPRGKSSAQVFSPSADVQVFTAVVFGAGDYHTKTEDRPLPPSLAPSDRLVFGSTTSRAGRHALDGVERSDVGRDVEAEESGELERPLAATIDALLDHPRLVRLRFSGSARGIWAGLARHGRPIQYAHVPTPLAMWDVWTPIAARPVAFEPPSAGFALDWLTIRTIRAHGIGFATMTLAAGISSTGDPALDERLPFDEPYCIPAATASAIAGARAQGGRIIAVGTTVVRGLEHAAALDAIVHPGAGMADQRIGPDSPLRVVDAMLTGTHEPASSHYQILRAFVDGLTLADVDAALDVRGYRTHEFGDSVLVERMDRAVTAAAQPQRETRVAPAA